MDYEGGGETDKDMGDSCDTGAANIACHAADQAADEEGVGVSNTDQSCSTRRVRVGKAPDEREPSPSRMPALEASVRAYVDRKSGNVVNPLIGTSFDSFEEGMCFTICIHGRLVLVSAMQ